MLFHDFREVLICSFSEDLISEEVLILHEEYGSRNQCFPFWEKEPFNLPNFNKLY